MLNAIRILVYKMGVRPKVNSVFFSQPLALISAYLEAIKRVKHPVIADFAELSPESELTAIVDRMEREVMTPEVDVRASLYHQMNFCVVCGSFLALLVVDVKECPHLHGKVYMSENNKGMPVIVFEPTERTDG